jgi:hypothetical protein
MTVTPTSLAPPPFVFLYLLNVQKHNINEIVFLEIFDFVNLE